MNEKCLYENHVCKKNCYFFFQYTYLSISNYFMVCDVVYDDDFY